MLELSTSRHRLADEVRKHGGLTNTVRKAIKVYHSHGMPGIRYLVRKKTREVFALAGPEQEPAAPEIYRETYLGQLEAARSRSPHFVDRRSIDRPAAPTPVKLIAYYLPQFHPFPENDAWWGKGFTEWTNVTKAQPHFVGHYQPRLPADLGFYDLRLPEVQKQQMEMARQYGIYGFCYYYYWFSGKRLMDRPLRQVLENKELDLPFCLSWANENWTRRWDGLDQEVLIRQEYNEEDELAFIRDVAPILQDERYIRVDGKPLLIVYGIYELPDPLRATRVWRDYCRQAGIGELYLAATKRFPGFDPRKYGCDAAIEFPPVAMDLVWDTPNHTPLYSGCEAKLYDYRQCVTATASMLEEEAPFPVFHGAMPSWDNTARRPDGKSYVFTNTSPDEYARWLRLVCEHTEGCHSTEEKLVFINAWNEWAEGAYLEPDRKYGYAYLEATAQAQESIRNGRFVAKHHAAFSAPAAKEADIAVILHLYHCEFWEEIAARLTAITEPFDLYLTVPERFDPVVLEQVLTRYPRARIRLGENRGRDIAPFLRLATEILPLGYQVACKIHTKKSDHLSDGKGWRPEHGSTWRRQLLDQLLGSEKAVRTILQRFRSEPTLGMVGPGRDRMNYRDAVGGNRQAVTALRERLNLEPADDFDFFAGSMFWFRPEALQALIDINLSAVDFPAEAGQLDGTLAHAVERLFGECARRSGFSVSCTAELPAAAWR